MSCSIRRINPFLLRVSLLAIAAWLQAPPALAQTADTKPLEEVIVTVERYEQSLQSYAGTAAAVSQATLDQLGVKNVLDLPSLIPGLDITQIEGNFEVFVRGIGSNANTELGDPGVATSFDDIYIPRPRGLGSAFFDLERVELNVGPQGTLRGRNTLAGTMNVITRKPVLGEFSGFAQATVGSYDDRNYTGAVNIPLGSTVAARVSAYAGQHDAYYKNTGRSLELEGFGSQDDVAFRAHLLFEPTERFSLLLSGDHLNTQGTPTVGSGFIQASAAGVSWDSMDDPRHIIQTAFTPTQDTTNWGAAINTTYRLDPLNIQFIGGYRDLRFVSAYSTHGNNVDFAGNDDAIIEGGGFTPGTVQGDEFLREQFYDNYSQLIWDGRSQSNTQELRVTSPDSADRLTWATGLYHFKEKQQVFLGIPLDYNTLPYLEFNQGSTIGESKGAYADATWEVVPKLKISAGARWSDESKERTGFNFIAGLATNGVNPRTGTPGFEMVGLGRPIDPDANHDGVINDADTLLLFAQGVAHYGAADTLQYFLNNQCVDVSNLDGTCAGYTSTGISFGSAVVQFGENSDSYLDWRFRLAYDLSDDHLLYGFVATGNKAPSFNDTVDIDPNTPGTQAFTPPVGPEKNTMLEIGSKNTYTLGSANVVANVSAYYLRYEDQVFSSLVPLFFLDNDTGNDVACTDADPTTNCPVITLNQNVAKAHNMGVQLDGGVQFTNGWNVSGTLLWQDTEYDDGLVSDNSRRGVTPEAGDPASPTGNIVVNLEGNELPRTPHVTLSLRVGQELTLGNGTFDWNVSGQYRSSYFMTAFNGEAGSDATRAVRVVDEDGNPTLLGEELLRLRDEQDSFVHFDAGFGYTLNTVRFEAYVNNLTDEEHAVEATINTNPTQNYFFNPPRTYGVRLRASF
jgi:iron complex outermembrane receptor protein